MQCKQCSSEISARSTYCSDKCRKAYKRNSDKVSGLKSDKVEFVRVDGKVSEIGNGIKPEQPTLDQIIAMTNTQAQQLLESWAAGTPSQQVSRRAAKAHSFLRGNLWLGRNLKPSLANRERQA